MLTAEADTLCAQEARKLNVFEIARLRCVHIVLVLTGLHHKLRTIAHMPQLRFKSRGRVQPIVCLI